MRIVPEYDLQNPATWVVIRERDVWSESEAAEFQCELVRIAGANPHGEPNLTVAWAVTHLDPQMPDGKPKYYLSSTEPVLVGHEFRDPATGEMRKVKKLEEVPASVLITLPVYEETHLGERRFIVEVWRSPEFLARTGRYQATHDYGESVTLIQCRNCGGQMRETGREDERVCVECGSRRQSQTEHRELKNERLLQDLPAKGAYDFFMRLEWSGDKFRPADGSALRDIEAEWEARKKSFSEKNKLIRERRQRQEQEKSRRKDAIWQAV